MTMCYAMQSLVGEPAVSTVRNGKLLATKRHKDHPVYVVCDFLWLEKIRKVREDARSNSES
jgi:hypothetical protein